MSTVAVQKTAPKTVLEDYATLMLLADYRKRVKEFMKMEWGELFGGY